MENKAHALAAGVFVLLLGALLAAMAIWLTRDAGVRQMYELSTREVITGLQPQANVRFRGVNVGKVVHIGFDAQVPGNVLVRIAVNENTPVTRSTFASLGFQGVTGLAFVQLDDNGEVPEALPSRPDQIARIPLRPGMVGQLAEQGARILKELEESSRRVNHLLSSDNQKTFSSALSHLDQAAAALPSALQVLQANFGDVANSANEVRKVAGELGRMARQVQQPDGVLEQLTRGTAALADGAKILQAETLPQLNRTLEDASRAARQVERVTNQLGDNPQALLFGPKPTAPGPGEPGFVAPGSAP